MGGGGGDGNVEGDGKTMMIIYRICDTFKLLILRIQMRYHGVYNNSGDVSNKCVIGEDGDICENDIGTDRGKVEHDD